MGKDLKWKFTTGGSVASSPSVVNGVLYVGSNDNNVYAIDSSTGDFKWSKKTNDWVRSAPAVFENSVYAGSNDNLVYSFQINNGDIRWTFKTGDVVDSSPIILKDRVYAGSEDGTIYVLDLAKGTLLDQYATGGGIVSLALSDGILFASSRDGYVYAFGEPIPANITARPTPPPDLTPPVLRINPVPSNVTEENLTVSGTAEDASGILVVTVNGANAGTNIWNATVTLSNGSNTITIVAVDRAGNIKTEQRTVTLVRSPVETPPEKIPGFYSFLSLSGIILALYILKLNKKRFDFKSEVK